jgi:hypothetical protein
MSEPKPAAGRAARKRVEIEELTLERETLQDLTPTEAEGARGGAGGTALGCVSAYTCPGQPPEACAGGLTPVCPVRQR